MQQWPKALVVGVDSAQPFQPPTQTEDGYTWHLSTAQVPGVEVGQRLVPGDVLPERPGFALQYRCVGLPKLQGSRFDDLSPGLAASAEPLEFPLPAVSLQQLGILEDDTLDDDGDGLGSGSGLGSASGPLFLGPFGPLLPLLVHRPRPFRGRRPGVRETPSERVRRGCARLRVGRGVRFGFHGVAAEPRDRSANALSEPPGARGLGGLGRVRDPGFGRRATRGG